MEIGLGCWVFDLFREKGIFLPLSQHWIINGILILPLEKMVLPDVSDKILNLVVASATWPSRSCAMLEEELWQPLAWIFLPLCAARFTAPQTWGNYIQKGTSQKYHANKWIAIFCKEQLTLQTDHKWFLRKSWGFSIKKLKSGREIEDVLLSLVEGQAAKPSWSILLLLWPTHAVLKTVCSPLAKPGFPPSCTIKPSLCACCCCSGCCQFKLQTQIQSITKSKASCGGDSVHLDLVQVE